MIMSEILMASNKPSGGIEQVKKAIGEIDDVTQQNAALVDQAAASAASLRKQTESLFQTVGVLRLGREIKTSLLPG
jgi:methyl-accepting chemotaxis protein